MQPTLRFCAMLYQVRLSVKKFCFFLPLHYFSKRTFFPAMHVKVVYESLPLSLWINEIIIILLLNKVVHASYTLQNTA